MNQQIKQLAEQTHFTIADSPLWKLKVEEFAVAIVNECAKIADIDESNPAGCGYITKSAGDKIRKHFGIDS